MGMYSGCVIMFVVFNTFLREAKVSGFFVRLTGYVTKGCTNKPTGMTIVDSTLYKVMSNSSMNGAMAANSIAVPVVGSANCGPRFTKTMRTTSSANKRVVPPVVKTTTFLVTSFINMPCSGVVIETVLPTLLCFAKVFVSMRLRTGGLKLSKVPGRGLPMFGLLVHGVCLLLPLIVLMV